MSSSERNEALGPFRLVERHVGVAEFDARLNDDPDDALHRRRHTCFGERTRDGPPAFSSPHRPG